MSGGLACRCGEHKKPLEKRNWRVVQYRCNHSHFNGRRYTPSRYSEIQCRECRTTWRTKAAYVDQLKGGDLR